MSEEKDPLAQLRAMGELYHQRAIARDLGVSQSTVSRWITGVTKPRGVYLRLIQYRMLRTPMQMDHGGGSPNRPRE